MGALRWSLKFVLVIVSKRGGESISNIFCEKIMPLIVMEKEEVFYKVFIVGARCLFTFVY